MKDELTIKQKAFADYYIETGNATEAAERAGYSSKTARQIATENLAKPNIIEYIQSRLSIVENSRIASGDEVMQFFTSVMRGEHNANTRERMEAAKELAKRTVDIMKPKEEYDDDGFLDALNNQASDIFENGGDIVET